MADLGHSMWVLGPNGEPLQEHHEPERWLSGFANFEYGIVYNPPLGV